MRLYIRSRVNGLRCPEYELVRGSEAALFWNSKSQVEQVYWFIAEDGITVAKPFSPERQPCSDFQEETRPLGGFAISCEVPVSL